MKEKFKRGFFVWVALNFISFFIVSRFVVLEGTNIGSWILLTNIVITVFIMKKYGQKAQPYFDKAEVFYSENISKKTETTSKFNDEFFTLWETKKPIEVTFKVDYETKSSSHEVIRYAISPNGYHKIFYINDNDQIVKVDEYDVETKFLYKSKRYDSFIDVLEQIIGYEKVLLIQDKEQQFFEELEEKIEKERLQAEREFQEREDSKGIIYSFSPKELKFSIFGDYFDEDLPPNHLRITLLCNGLYGYPDTKDVLSLTGIYMETGKEVNIRINAIVTMISFDGKKYSRDEFLRLAKTFN